MKRDMDLIRDLMLRLEAISIGPGDVYHYGRGAPETAVAGYSDDQLEYHYRLLCDAGFVEKGVDHDVQDGVLFSSLTWAGHDFVDSVRNPEIWAKTKDGALAVGGFTVDLLKDLAKGFIKKQIEARTGITL